MRSLLGIVAVVALVVAACSSNVFELEVGDCFDDPDNFIEVSDVEIVECEEPHDNEVYALFVIPDGDYPGEDALETRSINDCLDAFQPYVGRDFASSSLDASYLFPSSESWAVGDREVACFTFDFGGAKLNRSVAGSGL